MNDYAIACNIMLANPWGTQICPKKYSSPMNSPKCLRPVLIVIPILPFSCDRDHQILHTHTFSGGSQY